MTTPTLDTSSTSVVLMPVSEPRRRHKTARGRGRTARALSVVLLLVMGLFVGGVGASGISPAQASPFDFFCNYTEPPERLEASNPGENTFQAWPGIAGQIAQAATYMTPVSAGFGAVTGVLAGDNKLDTSQLYPPGQQVTAYEWWGTAGLTWTSGNYEDIGGSCGVEGLFGRGAVNIISNMIWGFVSTIGSFGLILYYYAATPDALAPFLDEGGPIDNLLSNSLDGIFLVFLAPIIVLTALWLAYVGLVKRRSSETVQGVVWMAGAATAAILFLSNPLTVPVFLNNAISQIQTTLLTVLTSSTAAAGGGNGICSLPAPTEPTENLSLEQQNQIAEANRYRSIRTSQCVQWQVFLFTPWAAGQFGSLSGQPVPDVTPVSINGFVPSAEVNPDDSSMRGLDPSVSMALVHLDAYTLNHNQVLAGGLTEAERATKIAQRQAIYDQMVAIWNSGAEGVTSPDVAAVQTWTGNDPSVRLGTSVLALLSMMLGSLPILLLTFLLLLYQLGTLFLLLLAPIFFTLGINPGWGRRIALGWVEQLLNLSIKRIGTTVLIAILLAVIQAIVLSGGPWIAQVFLVAATGIGILVFRGRILDMVASVNLGGTNSLDIEEATRQGAKRAGGFATGAVSGAGMALAGGAGLGAAAKAGATGAMAGGGSGKPMAGAMVGYGTATEAIRKSNQEKTESSRQAEEARKQQLNVQAAADYESLMERISAPDSGFTAEEIRGIRETRRNLGAQEGLVKANAMMGMVSERKAEAAAAQAQQQQIHEERLQRDPVYRHQALSQEQSLVDAERDIQMRTEIEIMRQEDEAMRAATVADADMWVARWRGDVAGGEGQGRAVPTPESEEMREKFRAAGVPMREWVKDDGGIPATRLPGMDSQPSSAASQNAAADEQTQRLVAARALRRAAGRGGGANGGPSRPPQA